MAANEPALVTAIKADERLKQANFITQLMRRPELGAVAGLVLVATFFFFTADRTMFSLSGLMTILAPASQLGILAIAASLLMIGGEFDLSIGSMVAFAGLIFATLLTNFHQPLFVAIAVTMILAAIMGAINGQIVIRTRLPSFIVTLAFLFILRGLTLVGLKLATGGSTQLRGIEDVVGDNLLKPVFSGVAFQSLFTWLAQNNLIEKFENKEIDILVGTQMVTKGLDFESVRLVGVLSADQLLHFPDFRASERAFQLITQVAGRAGRSEVRGTVLVQALDSEHPVINEVLKQTFQRHYERELAERWKFFYPPYFRLIHLIFILA